MKDKNLDIKLRAMVRQALQEGKLNELFDDEDENLGIYGGDFNRDEFQGDAMKAAMSDMGDEFTPLGKSQFDKNINPEEFMSDLERQNLNLPNDKAERHRLKSAMDAKNKHEKIFGAGSMNEESEVNIDEHHFDMKSIYNYFKDAFYSLSDMGPEAAAQILEAAFKRDFPTLQKHLDECTVQEDITSTEVAPVQTYFPKDSEGNKLKINTIVKDVNSNHEGRILRFGTTENGKNLVADVEWFDTGIPVQGMTPLPPRKIEPVNLIIRKQEMEEGMGQSYTIGKGTNAKPSNYPENLK